MIRPASRLLLATAAAALLAPACSDSPTLPGSASIGQIVVVSGDLQKAVAGSELPQPLAVRLVDQRGRPVRRQSVTFVVTSGNGSVFTGNATTNAAGEARERWRLGAAAGDTQRVEARTVDPATGQALVATFRAVGTPDVPAAVASVGEVSFAGLPGIPLLDSVAVVVRDRFGNPVPGATVAWVVREGSGSASPATSATGPDGVARTEWTLGPEPFDSVQVLEAAAGLAVATQFTANGPEVAFDAQLVMVSGNHQSGTVGRPLPEPVVLRVQDADGRPIHGIPVTFTGGSVNPSTAVSDRDGMVTAYWTLGTRPGTAMLTATLVHRLTPVHFWATAAAGPAASLQRLQGPARAFPGTPVALWVRVWDEYGNPVDGETVTWTAGSGTVSPATSTSYGNGHATTTYTPSAAGPGTVEASVASGASVTFDMDVAYLFLEVLSPAAGAAVSERMLVRASVSSGRANDPVRVKAAVGDREVPLPWKMVPVDPAFEGTIDLAGLPGGTKTLRVWAVSLSGDSVEVRRDILYLPTPRLTVTSPEEGTVARDGRLQVDVGCTDCTRVAVYLGTVQSNPVATGATSIQASVPVSGADGTSTDVIVVASNSAEGKSTGASATRRVLLESSPRWSEVASAGRSVLDVDGTRVIYLDGTEALKVRPLAGGAEALVDSFPAAGTVSAARLFPLGVIYTSANNLHEWRGGRSESLGSVGWYSLAVAGSWAVWLQDGMVYRRDLSAGSSTTLGMGSLATVAENGDVAYRGADDRVKWLHGGQTLDLGPGSIPVTDGVGVLYARSELTGSEYRFRIVRWSEGAETVLSGPISPYLGAASGSFVASGGWSAYLDPDEWGVLQVWTMSPDGTRRKVTTGTAYVSIVALAPNGDVVYEKRTDGYGTVGRRYASRAPYTSATDVGSTLGQARFVGGQLMVLAGRSVFRVSY